MQLTIIPDTHEEDEPLPSYNELGRLFFHFDPTEEGMFRYEVIGSDGSAFWLEESSCADYQLDLWMDLELEGYYVLEGITGYGWTDYWGEYDEEWIFQFCRRASQQEIDEQALF